MSTPATPRHARPFAGTTHACLVYDDPTHFASSAVTFFSEGRSAGHRLEYVGDGTPGALHEMLDRWTASDARLAPDDITIRPLGDVYGPDAIIDPRAQVAAYAEATQDAIRRGYAGLRVVAEATPLVRTGPQREAFARYEHLVDRYMVDSPFFALCAYDVRDIGHAAAVEIACLHPATNAGATTFRWHASPRADVALSGEVDIASHAALEATLLRTMPLLPRPTAIVDGGGLTFIDHRGLLMLDEHASAAGTVVTLRTPAGVVQRLAQLLELGAVHVAAPDLELSV